MEVSVEHKSPLVIKVQLAGRLGSDEWHAALVDVAKFLEPNQRASILLCAEGFRGWGPGEWDDMSFQREHDRQISRIAIVADEKWEARALMFAGQGLRDVDIQFFTPPDVAQARLWLESGA